MDSTRTTRRTFLGGVAGTAVAGPALATRGRAAEDVDLSDWLDNVDNATRVVDKTGQSEVEVEVGAEGNGGPYAYGPAVVRVDPGTTVVWSWVAGRHNVVAEDGSFESEFYTDSGTYERAFEETGVTRYYCTPHKAMGMKGVVVVGDVEVTLSASEAAPTTTPATTDGSGNAEGLDTYDGWLANVDNYEGVVDRTGQDVVEVTVGAQGNGGPNAFDPPAIHIDSGATVVWKWADYDGDIQHDVKALDGQFESDEMGPGSQYSVEFTGDGIAKYECEDKSEEGMRGLIIAGAGPGSQITTLGWAGILAALGVGTAVIGKILQLHVEEATGPGPPE